MEKNSLINRYQKYIIAGLSLFFLWLPKPVAAQTSTGGIQIEPAFQEVTLQSSDSTVSAQVKISNTSQNELEFDLQAISIQQFDANGSIILADKPIAGRDISLAEFISIPSNKIMVPPGENISLPILVTNSQSLGPGGHYAALVARLNQTQTSNQVVLPAISSFILVRKTGGELYNLSLIKSSFPTTGLWTSLPKSVDLTFSNQGNSHVIPRGTVEIHDVFNRLIAKATINENSLFSFPNTQRVVSQELRIITHPLPLSALHITISGKSQPGDVNFSQSKWVVFIQPLQSGICILVVVGMLSLIYRRVRHVRAK